MVFLPISKLSNEMNPKSSFEKPISANYVCKMLGIGRTSLHKWSKDGVIRSHKLGGKLFYFESEIIEDMRKERYSEKAG